MTRELLAAHPLFSATMAAYVLAFACYAAAWLTPRPWVGSGATALCVLGLGLNLLLILRRWHAAGRPPFQTLYESLVFFAFCIAAVYLVMERLHRSRAFGALAAAGALGALAYALGKWDAEIVKLPPALQSGWFIPHVVLYFVGYAAVFFATAVSMVQLLKPTLAPRAGSVLSGAPLALEDIAYDSVRFGFTMLTLGLFVGAVWAKAAWGDYWVWDPKESWSLVSLLVYGVYLHVRHVKGWRGRRMAWLAIAGFAVILFTYLGMELLPTAGASEHVYQW